MAFEPPQRIFLLCMNDDKLPEAELLQELENLLQEDPNLVHSTYRNEMSNTTPLHFSIGRRSLAFCKLLIEADPALETVRATDAGGETPFHVACESAEVEIAKYLFGLFPGAINVRSGRGECPLHMFVTQILDDFLTAEVAEEFTQFLLQHDRGAVSTPSEFGNLPLHIVCDEWGDSSVNIAKLIFDAYPAGVFERNNDGDTPIELATRFHPQVASFLEAQVEFRHLPIHQALQNLDVSLGTIKLIIEANPQCLVMADDYGQLPLHIACQVRGLDIVEYLVKANEDALKVLDSSNSLPLHRACRKGKCDIVNYILDRSDYGATMPTVGGMMPIHLLHVSANCDRSSVEYVNAVWRLLRTNPSILPGGQNNEEN